MVDLKSIKRPTINLPDFSLSKRPYYTLWYISEKTTYRLDANRKGEAIGRLEVLEEGCESVKDLPSFLEHLLVEATGVGRKIWVMVEDLSSHVLNVPTIQVEGVESDMLSEVLKFEHEALSGESMTGMHLAHTLLKSEDDLNFYWLSYLKQDTFDLIVKKLKKKRCKLAGLIHPGGMPLPLDDHQVSKNWLRLESWGETVFAFHYKKGEVNAFQILHPAVQTDSWQRELDEFSLNAGSVERSESFQNSLANPLPELTSHYSLSNHEDLTTQWLGQWLSILSSKEPDSTPVVKIPPHANQEVMMMVSYGLGALAFCGLLYGWNYYWIEDYKTRTEHLKKIEADITAFNKGIADDKSRQNNLSADIASLKGDLKAIPAVLDALQKRPMEVLEKLALGRPEDLVLEAITVFPEKIVVQGVTLTSELPNHLANYLDNNLKPMGFKIHSPTKVDMVIFEKGGPWKFEMMLEDLGLEGFSKLSQQAAAK
jgi:hypothetical protein